MEGVDQGKNLLRKSLGFWRVGGLYSFLELIVFSKPLI